MPIGREDVRPRAGISESTAKDGSSAAMRSRAARTARGPDLMSKRIPESNAEIVEVGPPRIAGVDQVGAPQQVQT